MFFTIVESHKFPPNARSRAFLVRDNWDDWRKYRTQFYLIVVDDSGEKHDIGSVKIGQVGLRPASIVEPGQRAPSVPVSFDNLGAEFFSVGQGEDYYLSLNQLSDALKTQVLVGLRDVAFDLEIFDANLAETVMTESLLRDVYESNVRFRLNRITRGDAQLTRFSFNYTLPVIEGVPPATMSFEVAPDSMPPTNVHVLIGRNGVGKTQCMRGLAQSLLNRRADEDKGLGKMVLFSDAGNDWSFAGVLLISFSAFDDFELRPLEGDAIRSTQVGLRRSLIQNGQSRSILKSPSDLATDFRDSLNQCRHGLKVDRWRSAVRTLETDDLFAEANITALLDLPDDNFRDGAAELLFSRLSSGHAIVLLTVTRLVELVDEKTLVLLDEPEGHLHPPLLSAFVRCLSDLLVKRNGVAIIATHSPVVLQEVPRACAWKLRRSRDVSVFERPSTETFGENIGLLTREVFGLEVTRSGFHQLLEESVNAEMTYTDVIARFDGQLEAEARAIVQALVAEREDQ